MKREARHVRLSRRAQVSVFIILTLIILITFGLLYALNILEQTKTQQDQKRISQIAAELFPPEKYMEFCLDKLTVQFITNQSNWILQNASVIAHNTNYPFLLTQTNYMLSKPAVAKLIQTYLLANMQQCLNLQQYVSLGYDVKTTNPTINVSINKLTISIQGNVPFTLTKASEKYTSKPTIWLISSPVGQTIDVINRILNQESTNNWFDQAQYMSSADNQVNGQLLLSITKEKIYPHTTYAISTTYASAPYQIRFAIAQSASQPYIPSVSLGACQINTECFENVDNQTCIQNNGTAVEQCADLKIKNLQLKVCGDLPSGSSWCVEQSGVGARFGRDYCVDGITYHEWCRDQKEELCAQTNTTIIPSAMCRTNTYFACASCKDNNCCNQYDCSWISNTCVPQVGVGACTAFTGINATLTCALSGDCGINKNVFGEKTHPFGYEDHYKELDAITKQPKKYNVTIPSYIAATQQKMSLSQLVSYTLEELQSITAQTPQTILTSKSSVIQQCNAYTPPVVTDPRVCQYCQSTDHCSAYLCTSLGVNCAYNPINNTCNILTPLAGLHITNVMTDSPITNVESEYILANAVTTNKPLQVTIQTSKPALCKATYLPNQAFESITTQTLSQEFSANHTISLRFIDDLPVLDQLKKTFDASDFAELAAKLRLFGHTLNVAAQTNPAIKTQVFNAILAKFIDVSVDSTTRPIIDKLIQNIEYKRYSIFITCISNDGSYLDADAQITFDLVSSCNAQTTIANTTSTTITTQTLSVCKYDTTPELYTDMKFTANCPISKYDISGDGFYTCTIPRQNQTIFVVCASPEYKPFILTPTLDDVNQDNTTIHIDAFGEVIFNTTIPLTCKTAVCQNTTCAATITDLTPILCYPKTDACIQEPSLMLQIEPVVVEKLEIKDITLQNRVLSYTTNIPAICVANTPKSVVAQTKNNNNYQAIINQATQVKITCTTTDQTASYITLVN